MSWTARISEGIVRAQARTNKQAHKQTSAQTNKRTNKQAHKQTNKQYWKQIIITIIITTGHRVRSMQRRHIIPRPEVRAWRLDQKSRYKVWVRGLSMKAGPEVSLRSLGQRSEHEGWTRSLVTKSGSEVWAWGLDWVTDLTPGDCRKINSRAVPYSIW